MARSRPLGVVVAGILTILSALAIFYLSLAIWAVSVVGGPYGAGGAEPYVFTVAGFAVLVFADAISILKGLKVGWYLSIVVWILMFLFLCIVYYLWNLVTYFGVYFIGGYPSLESIALDLVLMCPFLYTVGCLLYFQRANVKEYFGAVCANQTRNQLQY